MSKKKREEYRPGSDVPVPVTQSRSGRPAKKPEGLAESFVDLLGHTWAWINRYNEVWFCSASVPLRYPTAADKCPDCSARYDEAIDALKKVENLAKVGKTLLKQGKKAAEERIQQVQGRAAKATNPSEQAQEKKAQKSKAATKPKPVDDEYGFPT